ncbi:MAG: hypothetical protein AW10_03606 [Candidatus Accumulibacter appositus]|uniref:Uncharacterized protein n=1 Tax=Candidatus Accumulibacter appositus TaxID=1454003 RepID=A0A011N4W0_9PROT|nr:hypothetical protein [Accumulibacter sp.]EXI77593.1 MAG: hypothetical protein AW10_03606 [Candidatus Accumulibacter appositus]HRF03951.1 hypothetical protein [Accumulibacter sp.]
MTKKAEAATTRTVHPLADPLLQVALTWFAAFLVGWPLIQIAGGRGTITLFLYIFMIWGGLIVLLFIVSRSLRHRSPPTSSDDQFSDCQ